MQIARFYAVFSHPYFLSCILHQDRLECHQRWTTFLGWLFQRLCVPAVYPHCKWLWQYQPLTVRTSSGWHLACPCSSELLIPDPQSSDLPLGSSCAKHVYTYGIHTNGEEGLTHVTPIADICKKHQVHYHRFADDIQLYVSYNPAESEELNDAKIQLIQCIDEIRAWMLLHQLKLNDDKTEFMVLQSSHNLRVHGSPTLQLPQLTLTSTDTARNLGCFFDRHMQLDRLVSSYCSSAYYHLRTIKNIRHLLTLDACHATVRSLVLSRLDYCNALLGGLNNRQLDRLQRLRRQTAWAHYTVSSQTTLATDQDADHVQDMHIHVQSYTWLRAWIYHLFCGTLHACPCTSIVL